MPNYNPQTTTVAEQNTHTMKQFYDRKLLETAKTKFVHANFGQKRPIPRNNGKSVEFRRWNLFGVSTVTQRLTEGVVPDGQALSQSAVEARIAQYGAYTMMSDLLDMTAFDNVINDAAGLLGEQIGTVIEWVTRNAMVAGASAQFVGGHTDMSEITAADKLTVDDIRKAVRTLKKTKARTFSGGGRSGHFICIVDPDVVYDLQSDPLWQDVSKYSNAEQIYAGELGRMFGVVFVESTEGFVSVQSLNTTVTAHTAGSATLTLAEVPEAFVEAFTLAKDTNTPMNVSVGGTEYEVASINEAASQITLTTAISAAQASGTLVYSLEAGAVDGSGKAIPVHHTLIFGADSYGIIDVSGSGAMQTFIKAAGSSGAFDPLNQLSSVGCKVMGYTAKVLNNLWIIDIMSAATL